jgi:ABC-type oligopeptide transport system substrate-binding subunit
MTTLSDEKTRPPPKTAAAAITAVQAQLLEATATQENLVIETNDEKDQDVAKSKATQGGLQNYFVSCLLDELVPTAKYNTTARVFVRDQVGLSPDHSLLPCCHWLWHRHATDECSLW